MSIALLPPDLHAQICAYCDRDTLTRLSRTYRALSAPAFLHLWRILPSFIPLFLTLPEDALEYTSDTFTLHLGLETSWNTAMREVRILTISRELTARDLARFKMYSRFVLHIRGDFVVSDGPALWASPQAWRVLERAHPGPLVNLQKMDHNEWNLNDIQGLSPNWSPFLCLLGENLQGLNVTLDSWRTRQTPTPDWKQPVSPALIDFLVGLPRSCPRLEALSLTVCKGRHEYARHALADALSLLLYLRSLVVRYIPILPCALAHLSTLPGLVWLELEFRAEDYASPNMVYSCAVQAFPSLEVLWITADDLGCVVAVLKIARPSRLETIVVLVSRIERFASLTRALAGLPCGDSLTDLSIEYEPRLMDLSTSTKHESALGTPVVAIPAAAMVPLFELSNITKICIAGDCYVAMDDTTLSAMAHRWPDLYKVHLQNDPSTLPPHELEGGVTIAGIAEVARACRGLYRLRVAMAPVRRDAIERVLSQKQRPMLRAQPVSQLKLLQVGRPTIAAGDVAPFAAALSLICPCLRSIHHEWGETLLNDDRTTLSWQMANRWERMGRATATFVAIRRQEEKWSLLQKRDACG